MQTSRINFKNIISPQFKVSVNRIATNLKTFSSFGIINQIFVLMLSRLLTRRLAVKWQIHKSGECQAKYRFL